jgi:phage gp36-like protein
MAYVDRTALVRRFGDQEVTNLEDPDNTGVAAASVSADALDDASQEADSYIGVRYTLPLPSVPEPVVRCVCDIARFRLYKDRPTEEVKYRYERTIKWLEQLAKGSVSLNFVPALAPEVLDNISKPATPVAATVTTGVFSDTALGFMPALGVLPPWR